MLFYSLLTLIVTTAAASDLQKSTTSDHTRPGLNRDRGKERGNVSGKVRGKVRGKLGDGVREEPEGS